MSDLGNQQQNQSFAGILQVPGGITSTLKQVQDGDGNNTGLWLSSTNTNIMPYDAEEQVITATAGQTVFNLSISYAPATDSLQVFVNGLNKIVGIDYLETDTDTVTFLSGQSAGALVKFTTAAMVSNAIEASNVAFVGVGGEHVNVQDLADPVGSDYIGFVQSGTGAVTRSAQSKLRETVSVLDFGADPTGATDSQPAIQAALDSIHKTIYLPPGEYLLSAPLQLKNQANSFGKTLFGNKAQTYLIASAGMDCILDILKGADGALSLVLKDLRFSAVGAFTGWAIRALGTGTLIDSRIDGCWFGTGTLSAGTFYGKTVFSSFTNNVHELNKTFVRCTLASAASFINNKFFDVYDEMFYFDGTGGASNGIVIDGVNVLSHNRGSFIKAYNASNMIIANIDYQAGTTLVDSGQYCKFAELDSCTAQFANCRIISTSVAGYITAYKVDDCFKITASSVAINDVYMKEISYAWNVYGSNGKIDISNNQVYSPIWCLAIQSGASGDITLYNNKMFDIGYRPISAPSANSVNLTIDSNYVSNPCRTIATYCWYFYFNGYCVFKDNVTKITDSQVTYWISVDSPNNQTFIDGNTFIGTPTVGVFTPGNAVKTGVNNIGLSSMFCSSAIPTTGTWRLGDRITNISPAVGQPKGWICTVAGTPGTWVSEGNL